MNKRRGKKRIFKKVFIVISFMTILLSLFILKFSFSSDTSKDPFKKYYYHNTKQNKDFQTLLSFVFNVEYPSEYKKGVFDCSNMSAYLEWYLENKGFHTVFIVREKHMNLLVYTDRGVVAVEPTGKFIVEMKGKNRGILYMDEGIYNIDDLSYFEGNVYEDIYDMIELYGIEEMRWWNL